MITKVLTPDNLSTSDFGVQNNKVVIKRIRDVYPLTLNSGYDPVESSNPTYRRLLTVQDNLGIIHLDFTKTRSTDSVIATLPSSAPTPYSLTEIKIGNATVWIDVGSRNVYERGLTQGQRYIITLINFFDY